MDHGRVQIRPGGEALSRMGLVCWSSGRRKFRTCRHVVDLVVLNLEKDS
jgi:hypothetical protein